MPEGGLLAVKVGSRPQWPALSMTSLTERFFLAVLLKYPFILSKWCLYPRIRAPALIQISTTIHVYTDSCFKVSGTVFIKRQHLFPVPSYRTLKVLR